MAPFSWTDGVIGPVGPLETYRCPPFPTRIFYWFETRSGRGQAGWLPLHTLALSGALLFH